MNQCFFCESYESRGSYYPKFRFNHKDFEYKTCQQCGLVYISPLLDADDLKVLYSIDYHDEFYFNSVRDYPRQKALLQEKKGTGKILDYGCGDGSFLHYLRDEGYELHGAEYNPVLVQKLQATFPKVQFKTISSVLDNTNELYDIIHLGDVLEHLLNPKEIIITLRQRLAPGGILFVEGPIEHNFHLSYIAMAGYFKIKKLAQPRRVATMRPFHVLFANAKNQKSFFERIGFRTIHYQIFEWAWPFPNKWKQAKSAKQKLEYLIGKVSVASSYLFEEWGNRFYYIGS